MGLPVRKRGSGSSPSRHQSGRNTRQQPAKPNDFFQLISIRQLGSNFETFGYLIFWGGSVCQLFIGSGHLHKTQGVKN